jgi:hypothetical protein
MKRVLDDSALAWVQRCVWACCIAVYLTVFVGGVMAGGDELLTLGRAVGLTLVAGFLGKKAIGYLAGATLPEQSGRSADQSGQVGSLVELVESTNVAQQEDAEQAA